jgi:hypothetical protein
MTGGVSIVNFRPQGTPKWCQCAPSALPLRVHWVENPRMAGAALFKIPLRPYARGRKVPAI